MKKRTRSVHIGSAAEQLNEIMAEREGIGFDTQQVHFSSGAERKFIDQGLRAEEL